MLRRHPGALAALLLLALIVVSCALAPLYAARVSGTEPFRSTPEARVAVDGRPVEVLAENQGGLGLGTTPIGPTWRAGYFLGADGQGRDVMARLLYGGRTSLLIAGGATVLCLILAAIVGTAAGFLGGAVDAVLVALLDLLWAFPVYLLAISLSAVLISGGLHLGPVTLESDSLLLPVLILGVVYVPYAARPVRSAVQALLRADYVRAAFAVGGTRPHILRRHILPRVGDALLGLAPLIMAMALLTEAALSILSIGVQAPQASWGTLIADGQTLVYTRPAVAVAPGLAVVATVLALNLLGEALQEYLDPRRRARGGE